MIWVKNLGRIPEGLREDYVDLKFRDGEIIKSAIGQHYDWRMSIDKEAPDDIVQWRYS